MLELKKDFPVLTSNPNLVYLDSAASALRPQAVVDAMNDYYARYGVNVNRGIYDLSDYATIMYEKTREKVAEFLQAEIEEIIFTSGTTDGLNTLSRILEQKINPGDNIVVTRMEHHANLIPWQQLAKRKQAELRFIEITSNYELDLESTKKVIDERTKIVSVTAASNVLGTITPINEFTVLAHSVGALVIVDAAQLIPHGPINVKDIDCDFLVFSGHKLYGPTGVGVLYGKKKLLEELEPVAFGGDMISRVSYESASWAELPHKFEPGTPPIAEVIGLGTALDYLRQIGWNNIQAHEQELVNYVLEKLPEVATIIGPANQVTRTATFSFIIPNTHPHDIGDILNRDQIAVRVGHHCAMPLIQHLGLVGTTRAAFGIYNSTDDVDALIEGIKKVKKILLNEYL